MAANFLFLKTAFYEENSWVHENETVWDIQIEDIFWEFQ